MSFEAQNNIIRVTDDANGDVVFDTSTPMPHIAAVLTTNVVHEFPKSADGPIVHAYQTLDPSISGCREYQCNQEYICNQEYVCRDVYRCRQEYVCQYDFNAGQNVCGYETVCGYVEECKFENVCGYETVCDWVDQQGYRTIGVNRVSALEHSQTYLLGNVSPGVDPDFLLVLMTANRTVAGSQSDYGTFISAIPNGEKIAANGSTVLESAFIPGGPPWLSRIASVFLDGSTVKVEFKHSNRQYTGQVRGYATDACNGYPSPTAPPDDTRSTWDMTFEVYVGKFTR